MAIDILRNHAIQAMPESVASRSTKVAPKAPESLRGDFLLQLLKLFRRPPTLPVNLTVWTTTK